jgi:hypothetical protein
LLFADQVDRRRSVLGRRFLRQRRDLAFEARDRAAVSLDDERGQAKQPAPGRAIRLETYSRARHLQKRQLDQIVKVAGGNLQARQEAAQRPVITIEENSQAFELPVGDLPNEIFVGDQALVDVHGPHGTLLSAPRPKPMLQIEFDCWVLIPSGIH